MSMIISIVILYFNITILWIVLLLFIKNKLINKSDNSTETESTIISTPPIKKNKSSFINSKKSLPEIKKFLETNTDILSKKGVYTVVLPKSISGYKDIKFLINSEVVAEIKGTVIEDHNSIESNRISIYNNNLIKMFSLNISEKYNPPTITFMLGIAYTETRWYIEATYEK